jgi:hypothetical protein
MRGSDNRVPLLAAIFMALLFAAVPGPAEALSTPFGGAAAAANNCTGYTGVQLCQCQISNGLIKGAQDRTMNTMKIFSNASVIDAKLVYCFTSIVMPALILLGQITSAANGQNPIGSIIWNLIVNLVIIPIINAVCQMVASAVQAAVSFIKSLVCIPIPHFNLTLPTFHGGACLFGSGVPLFNLLMMAGATRPTTPTIAPPWNYTPPLGAP